MISARIVHVQSSQIRDDIISKFTIKFTVRLSNNEPTCNEFIPKQRNLAFNLKKSYFFSYVQDNDKRIIMSYRLFSGVFFKRRITTTKK